MFRKISKTIAPFTIIALLSAVFAPLSYGINVEITNINIDNFPGIHIFARVTDDEGLYIPDLGDANFEIRENGTPVSFAVEAHFGYMAVSLVMDQSGSMAGNEQDVIDACNYFVDGLDILDKGAIVKFATTSYVDVQMTYDKDLLYQSIAGYIASGMTDLWDAIYLGIEECYCEPEKKAVVVFTDGQDNQPGVFAAQIPEFAGTDITIYTIGIGSSISEDSLIYVAEATGGFYLPIEDPSQMAAVLEDIREDIGNLYDLYYTSPDPAPNGTVRLLELVCTFQSQADWDTSSYIAPETIPPQIALSESTLQMLGVSQVAGSSINITCDVRAPNPIEDARIYYKTTGEMYFSQADMVSGPGISYYYDIPAGTAQNPGIEFYLQVTDSAGNTVTLPAYNPSYLPFNIPVLPNNAPTIVYFPPAEWLTRRSLPIEAVVQDYTNHVDQVSLFYRTPGSFFYYESPMTPIGDDMYKVTIEGPQINEDEDIEMFIAAWDDQGTANYWYLSDEPYYLDIVPELGPTPPAVALEPASMPIIIPANGGSFDYTMYVINPIPDSSICDVWADLILPDGSIENLTMVIEDIELEGGEFSIGSYTQEVPDTAEAGDYLFRVHTGDYSTFEEYFCASFPFMKVESVLGPQLFNNGWRWYPSNFEPYEMEESVVFLSGDQPNLKGGYPNPFNSNITIEFYVPQHSYVTVVIHNISGEEVMRLADGNYSAGCYELCWEAVNMASGVYFCSLLTNNSVLTSKLLLIK